ncbi:MAG: hypothetical protein KAX55_07890 [Propionivibrio sp.]|nr:hypothetical protein [Propionivibrio sp.]
MNLDHTDLLSLVWSPRERLAGTLPKASCRDEFSPGTAIEAAVPRSIHMGWRGTLICDREGSRRAGRPAQ